MAFHSKVRLVLALLVGALFAGSVLTTPGVVERPHAGRPGNVDASPVGLRLPVLDAAPAPISVAAPAALTGKIRAAVPRVAAVIPSRAERSGTRPARVTRSDAPARFGPGWEQRHGAQALARITYPWREMGWQITFHPARRGVLGLAYESGRHIYIFVRRDQSTSALAFTIAHEIGHAFDYTYGSPERHARWRQLRGIAPDVPWHGCEGCSDLATPAGDLAEVFAVWQVGPIDYRSRMASLPSGERLRLLAREFGGA